jgi:Protein of unknown function (DUF2628)
MSVYTVHEPPLRATEVLPDPERFVFARDGFYFWAFLLTPLWMIRYRMWLVLVVYVVVAVGLENALYYAGVGTAGIVLVELLLALLIGFEAGTLRRFSLARRGWKNVGVVSGDDLEDAERRFFDAWMHATQEPRAAPSAPPPADTLPPAAHAQQPPDIVGLFPEPGASR